MIVGIYLRISSEGQARRGYSLLAQRESCTRRAQALGASQILEFADEGVSGSVLDRPGLKALRSMVKEGKIQCVVIYDPDRFARHLSHQLIVTEDEREKIRLRTMTGRIEKARQGKYPLGIAPYGYDYEDGQLHIVESQAKVVRRIYSEVTVGWGLNGIAKRLTADGIPTQKERSTWHRQVVRQIARNSVYMGIFYANRLDTSGMYTNKFRSASEKIALKTRDHPRPLRMDSGECPCYSRRRHVG